MIPGYNHNIKYNGKIFHVQTEDNGMENPYIITHVFLGGNILITRKSSYMDIAANENVVGVIKDLMKEQHKAVVKELINGVFDAEVARLSAPELAAPPQESAPAIDLTKEEQSSEKSLDEIILEYLSKDSK